MSQLPPIIQAIEALKNLDRRKAAGYLRQELADGGASVDRLRNVARLAATIGEMDIEIDALHRVSQSPPVTLERLLAFCEALARYGRVEEVFPILDRLPAQVQAHPTVLHFRGTVATHAGDFVAAQACFRKVLENAPLSVETWHALGVVKTFTPGDDDIRAMEALTPQVASEALPQLLYTLGKAYDDIGQPEKAANLYSPAALLIAGRQPFDAQADARFAACIAADYSTHNLSSLKPSGCDSQRVIFINGLPRSGTTLVEQILAGHSQVRDGGELNLLKAALIPAGDLSLAGARAYEARNPDLSDPWGELASDYLQMITERFGPEGRVFDKTLNQARLMGLLLHILPQARVIWLRRNPEDCALSCFRTYFTASVPWSWAFSDIAAYFRSEDALYRHWSALFPDRILTVPYESLVSDPQTWTRNILAHAGLPEEAQVFEKRDSQRSIITASVAQARQPISTARIGAAAAYAGLMEGFRSAYRAEG